MTVNELIIQKHGPGLAAVTGILNPQPELRAVVGTLPAPHTPQLLKSAAQINEHLVAAVRSGVPVADTMVKFAQPIVMPLDMSTIRNIGAITKEASAPVVYTMDDHGISKALRYLNGMEKTAALTDQLIHAIDTAEVTKEGNVELNVPIKLAFRDDKTRELFMSLGKGKNVEKRASVSDTRGKKIVGLIKAAHKAISRKRAVSQLATFFEGAAHPVRSGWGN